MGAARRQAEPHLKNCECPGRRTKSLYEMAGLERGFWQPKDCLVLALEQRS